MTDVDVLKERIKLSGMTVTYIAEKAGITRETFYNRLSDGDFKGSEIYALSRVLGLTQAERDRIFFANNSE